MQDMLCLWTVCFLILYTISEELVMSSPSSAIGKEKGSASHQGNYNHHYMYH